MTVSFNFVQYTVWFIRC